MLLHSLCEVEESGLLKTQELVFKSALIIGKNAMKTTDMIMQHLTIWCQNRENKRSLATKF